MVLHSQAQGGHHKGGLYPSTSACHTDVVTGQSDGDSALAEVAPPRDPQVDDTVAVRAN